MNVVGIVFENRDKIFYCDANNFKLKKNLTVIVENDKLLLFATVVSFVSSSELDSVVSYKIVRISTKKDYLQHLANLRDAKVAIDKCRELVRSHGLGMSIIDATYSFDRSQLMFRFVADSRVDFRSLAKELGSYFKTRIELRQIGIRDKAKEVGGIGFCGRGLCCSTFLTDFDSVSINMAKNQAISLNPSKINGVCGRLLCCLKYENDNYNSYKKGMPEIGQVLDTAKGKGKVVYIDLFNRKYKVYLEQGGVVEFEVKK